MASCGPAILTSRRSRSSRSRTTRSPGLHESLVLLLGTGTTALRRQVGRERGAE
eukprot:CAMPEP_0198326682 /NCGR_PEP_ID=MMETSP1450-20131203/14138_1 /TAXON_ID=753684 ORGANISM="Madagascaria erythrocladiodes, Strain CCMP3234" /NCGR_SAMPLE_ID=MMETSP1450 /ASSEMBLY_ACC=CAM_ASM_001115 /LENGTH=53 /DNA_ID=CAMNT_0044030659 /DNA_START=902 /DNA_END=1060 /DNA_ORIENTATION=-